MHLEIVSEIHAGYLAGAFDAPQLVLVATVGGQPPSARKRAGKGLKARLSGVELVPTPGYVFSNSARMLFRVAPTEIRIPGGELAEHGRKHLCSIREGLVCPWKVNDGTPAASVAIGTDTGDGATSRPFFGGFRLGALDGTPPIRAWSRMNAAARSGSGRTPVVFSTSSENRSRSNGSRSPRAASSIRKRISTPPLSGTALPRSHARPASGRHRTSQHLRPGTSLELWRHHDCPLPRGRFGRIAFPHSCPGQPEKRSSKCGRL